MSKLGTFLIGWGSILISGVVVVVTITYVIPIIVKGMNSIKIITDTLP